MLYVRSENAIDGGEGGSEENKLSNKLATIEFIQQGLAFFRLSSCPR